MSGSVEVRQFISRWSPLLPPDWLDEPPWVITEHLQERLEALLGLFGSGWIREGSVVRHGTAAIAPGVSIQGPLIIGPGATVAPNACLRGGVFLDEDAHIGSSCEIKSSLVLSGSAIAHLNYIGNSLIGSDVNLEAGAVLANHFNEREDKIIPVRVDGSLVSTGVVKFGALVGDRCRIGANAVTTPGTLLAPGSIVGRLQLVDQVTGSGAGRSSGM